jgi:hypothetical protein
MGRGGPGVGFGPFGSICNSHVFGLLPLPLKPHDAEAAPRGVATGMACLHSLGRGQEKLK